MGMELGLDRMSLSRGMVRCAGWYSPVYPHLLPPRGCARPGRGRGKNLTEEPMPSRNDRNEALVLELVQAEQSVKLERLVAQLPQLSWNQVFHCIDQLSRRGEIQLLRRGFDYEITWVPKLPKPHAAHCSV